MDGGGPSSTSSTTTTLGCAMAPATSASVRNRDTDDENAAMSGRMIFSATSPHSGCVARKTTPRLPVPSSRTSVYSPIESPGRGSALAVMPRT